MVTEKLNEYITSKGISMYAFENSLGVSRGSISKAVKENKSIGSQVLENILSTYTDLNPDWLLTGRGSMLRADGTPTMRATPSTNASTPSDAIALRLMDKLDEKDNIIKEKEVENKHLQSELLSAKEELAAFKAKYPEFPTDKPVGLGSSETAPHAPSHPHSPTSEHYHGGSLPPQENQ